MDRDQSIELARVLNREYQSADELNSRITDCEERLAKPFNAAIEERNTIDLTSLADFSSSVNLLSQRVIIK